MQVFMVISIIIFIDRVIINFIIVEKDGLNLDNYHCFDQYH